MCHEENFFDHKSQLMKWNDFKEESDALKTMCEWETFKWFLVHQKCTRIRFPTYNVRHNFFLRHPRALPLLTLIASGNLSPKSNHGESHSYWLVFTNSHLRRLNVTFLHSLDKSWFLVYSLDWFWLPKFYCLSLITSFLGYQRLRDLNSLN
jgi:hypothetical protein